MINKNMQTWDKVRVVDWYYQWQEWHIEWFKKGQCLVVLQNDFWVVNTLLPEKRLDIIKDEYVINNKDMHEVRVAMVKWMVALKNVTPCSDYETDLIEDAIILLHDSLKCLRSIAESN